MFAKVALTFFAALNSLSFANAQCGSAIVAIDKAKLGGVFTLRNKVRIFEFGTAKIETQCNVELNGLNDDQNEMDCPHENVLKNKDQMAITNESGVYKLTVYKGAGAAYSEIYKIPLEFGPKPAIGPPLWLGSVSPIQIYPKSYDVRVYLAGDSSPAPGTTVDKRFVIELFDTNPNWKCKSYEPDVASNLTSICPTAAVCPLSVHPLVQSILETQVGDGKEHHN